MSSKLKRREEMVVALTGKVKGLEERSKLLSDELEQLRAQQSTKPSTSILKTKADRSDSVIVFDASKIPVELSSSLSDLNDVFSALQETPYGKEAIQSLYPSTEAPAQSLSDQEKGEPLRNLVRIALQSPKKR